MVLGQLSKAWQVLEVIGTQFTQGGPWCGLGGPDLSLGLWGALSCLSDDAVTPLLNFVLSSEKEDVKTWSWAEARAGGRQSILGIVLSSKPKSRPRNAGRRRTPL